MDALPSNALGQKLCTLFPYRWGWIEAPADDNGPGPRWSTETKYPIKPRVLWAKYQDAATLIGVRFGPKTRYAVIDVDAESAYLGQLHVIFDALETIGITRAITVRSSWSGGVHIYAPFPKSLPTFGVALAIRGALEAQGLNIAAGQLEVFPNTKTFGKCWLGQFTAYNPHRLPLQPGSGSCILDNNLCPIPGGESLSRFFALWDNCENLQDLPTLENCLSIAKNNRRRRKATGPVESWRNDIQTHINEGWTGPGQTNHMLKEIGCYGRVFEGLAGVELAEYIERVATAAPGYERWCRHRHEIWRRCCVWGRAVERYYWPLGAEPLRDRPTLAQVCDQRATDAQRRISEAVAQLPGPVATVKELATQICSIARCSLATLYKYAHLWHPRPPAPKEDARPVTDQGSRLPGPMGAIRAQILQSLESADLRSVTGFGGEDEMWSAENLPFKILKSGSDGGGPGGEGLAPGSSDG